MQIAARSTPAVEPNAGRLLGALLATTLWLAGCAVPAPVAPVAAAAPVQPVPFNDAVLKAATTVFSTAPARPGERQIVVIDPLVDGVTGGQSHATQQIGARIATLVAAQYPQFEILPFTPQTVARAPLVLVGTFTPVNAAGQTSGDRSAYRFCLVLADLRSGKTVAKGVARAQPDGVDATPTRFFQDSPGWTDDARVKSYINTCQATKVGDAIDPAYLDGIATAAVVSDAIAAYDSGRYRDALSLYRNAEGSPAGHQLRVYNGVYLASWKLGRRDEAEAAFGDMVGFGLDSNRLAMKLLFRPGSTALQSGDYDMWLKQMAAKTAAKNTCLQVNGHTSKTGSPVLNERLSLLRAEYVERRLEENDGRLKGKMIANGVGAKENLVGTAADNAADALDRRVEFKPIPDC